MVIFEVAFKLEYKCECMKVGAGTRRPVQREKDGEGRHWFTDHTS